MYAWKKQLNWIQKSLVILGMLVIILSYPAYSYVIDNEASLNVLRDLVLIRFGLKQENGGRDSWLENAILEEPEKISISTDIVPFRQIGGRLGERATHNGYNTLWARGATIFDANGDGRLDFFLPNIQKTFVIPTDENNLLMLGKKAKAKPNTLYINQGNDENGDPVFTSIQELQQKGNNSLVEKELIIEGKYQPRKAIEDDEFAPGRIGWGAVSADFNADGRIDLYVLNSHFGAPFQTADMGFHIYPAGESLGRNRSGRRLLIRTPSFLRSKIEDGLEVTVTYGNSSEPEGRNTLYLNLGDNDGDGIPEWEDVTDSVGVGGKWASTSAAIADYDRDGDLDMYVTNFLDPDYYGFGSKRFAGHRNQLYKNMLAETGGLSFSEIGMDLKVSGLHDEEGLSSSVYMANEGKEVEISYHVVDGKQVGEKADHSWAASFHDWNNDGWLDLVVANDLGNRLRVYKNLQGEAFEYMKEFDDQVYEGCWMGMSSGDLDGDGTEEFLVTNCGSQMMSVQNTRLLLQDDTENNITALASKNYAVGRNTLNNELLKYDGEKFQRLATQVTVKFLPYMRPDQSVIENFSKQYRSIFTEKNFGSSLTSIEFAFNAPMFDIDNDGDLDLYFAGALGRGNDGLLGDLSGGPGRLLINESKPGNYSFIDKTVEYQLLDISGIDYSHNPPRRKSPGSGWNKRDYIYLTDRGGYMGMGVDAAASNTNEMFRIHEQAQCVLNADLNGDGYQDILVTHMGSYYSNSPNARNLKVKFLDRVMAVPAFSKLHKAPTGYEEGETYIYVNGGTNSKNRSNWVKLRLLDNKGYNRYGIGSKITANNRIVRRMSATSGASTGSSHDDVHVGLGDGELETIDIVWPSGSLVSQKIILDKPVKNQTICIDRQRGIVNCVM